MLVLQCKACGKDFEGYPCDVRTGRKKYCSVNCRAKNAALKHGQSKTRLHVIWRDMKSRCSNQNLENFQYYGGRGITVCSEWINSFESFRDWAEANGYSRELELDRIDNDKGYGPGNCRWAKRNQQMSNTRKRRNAITSKFKGVSWCANARKWRTQIQHERRHRHVGLFVNEEDAARAYDTEARRTFGEFALLNFKEEGAPS